MPAGVPAALGGFESIDGIFTGAGEVTDGFSAHGGALDGGEIPGAHQAGPWPGIPTGGGDAVASFVRQEGGGYDPTVVTLVAQIPGEPRATGPGFLDEDALVRRGVACADPVIAGGWSRPDGAAVGDLSAMVLSDRGAREGVVRAIEPDRQRARLAHG